MKSAAILSAFLLTLSFGLGPVNAAETHRALSTPNVNATYQARSDIGQLILKWGYFRDHGMWSDLLDTFHHDGEIQVSWFKGKFPGFVEASRAMAQSGAASSHVMKPSIIDIAGDRAIAITPVTIQARARGPLGIELDVSSEAQFFDFVEKRADVWRIARRLCIYQKDRMDSVGPSLRFWLIGFFIDEDAYDPAYRYLALSLSQKGYAIQPGQIVDNTDESRALFVEARRWLSQAGR
ncbi:nuclear transport factor 2 family protein [Hydrocarboniphaga effusa]|jgi:hypothetical protein|uniref:SnoaL-like domain-containing protein n=1 Tax=Hydrocarboniphaga effusa AP103 TaxID=1172194 RepID=I8TA90_9GAMM|nr:hypothetical protein WQQ_07320 [Hydrocarboniphaga effusa AP103]